MKKYFLPAAIAVILALAFFAPDACAAKKKRRSKPLGISNLSAKAAVVLDVKSKKVIYAKNIGLTIPPASTTKLMTALLVLENLGLDKMITVSKRAAGMPPSRAGLRAGAQYRARDLFSACLISSSNDAACALAEAVSGSEIEFARLMNKRAKEIGMKNTYFANASGLPEKNTAQYSTVYDLAILMRYILSKPAIIEELGAKKKTISGSDGGKIYLVNHNKMLWRKNNGTIGKTGYTRRSRHCFAGAAGYNHKKSIVFAMLSSRNLWQDLGILVNHGLYLKEK